MVVRGSAAPPTPWSKSPAQPNIDATAYVHSFSTISGEVHIGANVLVAPGASIRADEGSPFYVGESSNIQDGVIIHGLGQGQVLGDDQKPYSVWIGKNTSITHMALIHGPAYVGDDCFVGFRSTVFNARVGKGSIIMMHVLVQDVEIPPGKYVPSGSVITTQRQADRLPDAQSVDVNFASHVVGRYELQSSYPHADTVASVPSVRDAEASKEPNSYRSSQDTRQMPNTHLDPDVVNQVRQLLAGGYRIGTEHADTRRFQTSSWHSCAPISATRESEVLITLEACLTEHGGEYVRLFGIDTTSKRRVSELIIQRPSDQRNGRSPSPAAASHSSYASSSPSPSRSYGGSAPLSLEAVEQIRQLLRQGYRIGMEHADKRRFQTGSWYSCTPITSNRESDVFAGLEACLAEHQGEYVRLFGIDSNTKRRVREAIVQRPGGQSNGSTASAPPRPSYSQSSPSSFSSPAGSNRTGLSAEVVAQVRQFLGQGYHVGTEHADKRRFQTGSWYSCSPVASTREAEVLSALEACIHEHSGEYIRLFGIDTQSKRRVGETIIQRP